MQVVTRFHIFGKRNGAVCGAGLLNVLRYRRQNRYQE